MSFSIISWLGNLTSSTFGVGGCSTISIGSSSPSLSPFFPSAFSPASSLSKCFLSSSDNGLSDSVSPFKAKSSFSLFSGSAFSVSLPPIVVSFSPLSLSSTASFATSPSSSLLLSSKFSSADCSPFVASSFFWLFSFSASCKISWLVNFEGTFIFEIEFCCVSCSRRLFLFPPVLKGDTHSFSLANFLRLLLLCNDVLRDVLARSTAPGIIGSFLILILKLKLFTTEIAVCPNYRLFPWPSVSLLNYIWYGFAKELHTAGTCSRSVFYLLSFFGKES